MHLRTPLSFIAAAWLTAGIVSDSSTEGDEASRRLPGTQDDDSRCDSTPDCLDEHVTATSSAGETPDRPG